MFRLHKCIQYYLNVIVIQPCLVYLLNVDGDWDDRRVPLVRTLKQKRVEQVILSGILPVIGRRGHRYRNCRGMAINMLVENLCREEEVGLVDLWGSFVGRADMYMKDGLHLSGKGQQYLRMDSQQQ